MMYLYFGLSLLEIISFASSLATIDILKSSMIFKKENEIYKKNFSDKYVEKKGNVCKGKNNIPTSKIKYRNILYRNKVRNPKVKSFSYSNFYRQKFS